VRGGAGRVALVSGAVESASRGGNFGNKLLTEITHAEWLKKARFRSFADTDADGEVAP
jgi:ribosome-binding ATPase YchF (GTP1/OBG family)